MQSKELSLIRYWSSCIKCKNKFSSSSELLAHIQKCTATIPNTIPPTNSTNSTSEPITLELLKKEMQELKIEKEKFERIKKEELLDYQRRLLVLEKMEKDILIVHNLYNSI